ncbi:hypothetical protein B0H19DRAFT_1272471 [Mycena capillaripes]|nr:hypothetical protein B0H19DRAFT_1272471 [Mycena capillaripes]
MCWGSPSSPKVARLSQYIAFPAINLAEGTPLVDGTTIAKSPDDHWRWLSTAP